MCIRDSLWAVSAPKLGLVLFVYEDGSRSEQVILNVFSDYTGTIPVSYTHLDVYKRQDMFNA